MSIAENMFTITCIKSKNAEKKFNYFDFKTLNTGNPFNSPFKVSTSVLIVELF